MNIQHKINFAKIERGKTKIEWEKLDHFQYKPIVNRPVYHVETYRGWQDGEPQSSITVSGDIVKDGWWKQCEHKELDKAIWYCYEMHKQNSTHVRIVKLEKSGLKQYERIDKE